MLINSLKKFNSLFFFLVLADEDDDEIVANGNVKLPVQKADSPVRK